MRIFFAFVLMIACTVVGNIFMKLGVNRQAELASLVQKLAALR